MRLLRRAASFLLNLPRRRSVRIFLAPLTTLFTTPVQLARTLWNCRTLLDGKWALYNRFTPHGGLNSLCYHNAAENILRHGRSGTSDTVGLGSFPLSNWFHFTLPSLYAYRFAANAAVLASMLCWLLLHLLWIPHAGAAMTLTVMGLAAISTTVYANTFFLQNYNAMGWAFLPAGLYGLFSGSPEIALLAWLGMSFTSFTATVMAGLTSLTYCFVVWAVWPALIFLPAGLKLVTHMFPLAKSGRLREACIGMLKTLDGKTGAPLYRYTRLRHLSQRHLYYLGLYVLFFVCGWIIQGHPAPLFLAGTCLYLCNIKGVRLADDQGIRLLMLSLAAATVLQDPHQAMLVPFWLLASPLPRAANFPSVRNVLNRVPTARPFPVGPIVTDLREFLAPVPKGQRVLMAFEDPQGTYEDIYDGYRVLVEPIFHCASLQGVLFLPNIWAIYELNHQGARGFWGRDPDEVMDNAAYFGASHAVIYQTHEGPLDSKWTGAGFVQVGEYRWSQHAEAWQGRLPFSGPVPSWFLLRVPSGAAGKSGDAS